MVSGFGAAVWAVSLAFALPCLCRLEMRRYMCCKPSAAQGANKNTLAGTIKSPNSKACHERNRALHFTV